MPRISLPSPDQMDVAQRAVYDKIVSGPRGKIQGPLRAALHNAELADKWQALGALLRYFRDLDIAEEAFQEASLRALRTWPRTGPPRDPAAWLILVGRNFALDDQRTRTRQAPLPPEEMRAVNLSAPVRLYGLKEIQSPSWMSPTVLPPWAEGLFCGATPSESP